MEHVYKHVNSVWSVRVIFFFGGGPETFNKTKDRVLERATFFALL